MIRQQWIPTVIGLCLAALPTMSLAGDKVKIEQVKYGGWKNNLRLSNGEVELIATLDVGPRIMVYRFLDGNNVFKEYSDQLGKAGEKSWQIRGGHRVWTAPEDLTRTYALDNSPITWKELDDGGVRLIQSPDKKYGIQKEIDIHLASKGSEVTIINRIKNIGKEKTKFALWALSVMAPGGHEIIPLAKYAPHPGPPENAKSPEEYAPDQHMVMWSYFRFGDARWNFGPKYITLKQDKTKGPTKIGLAHQQGWVAYWNAGTLFVKHIPSYQKGKTYPDRGCNYETFTNEDMLEMELLSPISTVNPGTSMELKERWQLFAKVPQCQTATQITKQVLPLIKK